MPRLTRVVLSGDVHEVRRAVCGPGRLFHDVQWVERTGSTNADLGEAEAAGAGHGSVLIADHQTAGRGRFARRWEAPPGTSVAISVLLRPAELPSQRWPWLPLMAGVAVADGLSASAGVAAQTKWPNDVLIDERKVCGILCQRSGDAAIVGMGINTTLAHQQLPVPTATSLTLAGSHASTTAVVIGVLQALARAYRRWLDDSALSQWYQSRCATIGRQVRVLQPDGSQVSGIATGVDEQGRLLVDDGRGLSAYAAADVTHLR